MFSSQPVVKPMVLACMDSGVGGLAVLQRVLDVLPTAAYVFVGDSAWMPYGEKPLHVVKDRVVKIHTLLNQRYSLNAFILACNTGTVAAFETLNQTAWGYPLLEPVSTTAQWVNGHVGKGCKIGIMATPGTVSSGRYLELLDPGFEVSQVGCTGLATLIESGCTHGAELEAALEPFLTPLQSFGAEVVILGCTHYSLVQPVVQKLLGPKVQLVDSATLLAKAAVPVLSQLGLAQGQQEMRVTANPQAFAQVVSSLPLPAFHGVPVLPFSVEEATPDPTPSAL